MNAASRLGLLLLLLFGGVTAAPPVAAQSIELVSRDLPDSTSYAYRSVVSANGRYVLFMVVSAGFCIQWYVRDRWLGVTELVSRNASGEPAVCLPSTPAGLRLWSRAAISADGRYVAFFARAINLVPGEVTGRNRTYHLDRQRNQMRLALPERPGLGGDVLSDMDAAGGRVAVFFAVNGVESLAWVDVGLGEQTIQAIGCAIFSARLSGDGRRLACRGATVVPPPPPFAQIVMLDLVSGQASTVSLDDNGQPAPNEGILQDRGPAINFDGSVIAYEQWNYADPALPWGPQTWVRLLNENRRLLVSRTSAGQPGRTDRAGFWAAQDEPALSDDGMRIAFRSNAWNFPGGMDAAPGPYPQTYVFDRAANRLTLVSRNIHGRGALSGSTYNLCDPFSFFACANDGLEQSPAISGDGRIVTFDSFGPDLIPNDPLQRLSVYAYDLGSTTQGGATPVAVPAGNWANWIALALLLGCLGVYRLRLRRERPLRPY